MRKDISCGIGMLFISVLVLWFGPVIGMIFWIFGGPIFATGLWLIANGIRKRRADKWSSEYGTFCFGKVVKIEAYAEGAGLSKAVRKMKRISACIYDSLQDRFLIVADIMDEADIDFVTGDFVSVKFFNNDFNYITSIHNKAELPERIRAKFAKLISYYRLDTNSQVKLENENNVDTSSWIVTEEAYAEGEKPAVEDDFVFSKDEVLMEKLIDNVETVSALKDYDADEARRKSWIAFFVILGVEFLGSGVFYAILYLIFQIR